MSVWRNSILSMGRLVFAISLILAGLLAGGAGSAAKADSFISVSTSCGSNCSTLSSITANFSDNLGTFTYPVVVSGVTYQQGYANYSFFGIHPIDPVCYDIYLDDSTALNLTKRIQANYCISIDILNSSAPGFLNWNDPVSGQVGQSPLAAGSHSISVRRLWVPYYPFAPAPPGTVDYVTTTYFTVVAPQPDSFTASANPSSMPYLGTSQVAINGALSTGSSSFAVKSGNCTVSGSGVASAGAGNGACVITATVAADDNYLVASSDVTIPMTPAAQIISFAPPPSQNYAPNGTVVLTATPGASTSPVSFSSTSTSVCTTGGSNGATVTFVSAGTCNITASQAADSNYFAAPPVNQSFTISQATQVISFTAPATQTYVPNATVTLSATTTSGLVVSYVSNSAAICSVSGNTVSILTAGSCSITASQVGSANYTTATPVTKSFTIGQATQVISFTPPATQTYVPNGTVALSATGGASGLPVTFASTSTGVCTTGGANGATVTFVTAGQCNITASQLGNTNYLAATNVPQSFTISKAAQTVAFTSTPPSNALVSGPTYVAVATGGNSGMPVTFTADASSAGSVPLLDRR